MIVPKYTSVMGKREDIFEAGRDLIIEGGIEPLTLSKIFARAKVGSGTVYHYFSNKEDLLDVLYRETAEFMDREVAHPQLLKQSICDRDRVERSPQVPDRNGAIGCPALRMGLELRHNRCGLPSVVDYAGPQEARVADGEDVGTQKVKDQKHFGSPASDAAQRFELRTDLCVAPAAPGGRSDSFFTKCGRKLGQVLHLPDRHR